MTYHKIIRRWETPFFVYLFMGILQIALSQYGVQEIVGKEHNPIITNYAKEIGHKWVVTDETAWCSIFINWCALKSGLERSGKLDARSWLGLGEIINHPQPGDIVIFWRQSPTSWKGHVGIYIGHSEDGQQIYCLGGNQSNKVCIQSYPANRLLGFRRLRLV